MFDGYAINFPGKGNESTDPTGEPGDFNAVCDLTYDTNRYTIEGCSDLYEKIRIPYYDALLGCDYIIEKPDGTKRKIKIPSCVKNGKILKLTGEGVQFVNSKSDYYIVILYDFPTSLAEHERKALESIKTKAEHK